MDEELRKEARELAMYVRRVRVGYSRYMARDLEKFGVNIPQYSLLAVLDEKGETTMGVLAEALGITLGAVTNLVDRLIDSGLATRERGTDDRRIVNVQITDKGREMLEKAMGWVTDYLAFYLANLDPEERKALIHGYRKMADGITSIPYEPPAAP